MKRRSLLRGALALVASRLLPAPPRRDQIAAGAIADADGYPTALTWSSGTYGTWMYRRGAKLAEVKLAATEYGLAFSTTVTEG